MKKERELAFSNKANFAPVDSVSSIIDEGPEDEVMKKIQDVKEEKKLFNFYEHSKHKMPIIVT